MRNVASLHKNYCLNLDSQFHRPCNIINTVETTYMAAAYMIAISVGQNLSLLHMTKKLNRIWRPPMLLTKPLTWRVKFENGSVLCLLILK